MALLQKSIQLQKRLKKKATNLAWNLLTKTIDTLIEDVREVLKEGLPANITKKRINQFGKDLGDLITTRLTSRGNSPTLRMSNIGTPCVRKLHLEINTPEEREELSPETYLKFLYGDIIEEIMLFLAEAAGHTVEGRQGKQTIEGIDGHRDAIIDGTLVDVKSASSFAFKKFENGTLEQDDPFGYITQLQSYLYSSQDEDILTDKNRAAFWAVDKVLGKQTLHFVEKKDYDWPKAYRIRINQVDGDTIPDRAFEPVPDGYVNAKTKEFVANGNMKLPMICSYCSVKHACHDGLRTFLSSQGPRYLTHVEKKPRMVEVDREGNAIEQ